LFRIEDKRHISARVATRANGRSRRTRAHATAAGRLLQAAVSPKDHEHCRNDASANRAGLLEFI